MEENLAVLIDFENIAAGTEKEGLGRFDVAALMDRLKGKGRILVARSYGDWGRFARFKQELLSANITMMELTSHGMQDKNRADIAMVVDCLELAFTRDFVSTFVIVSGDSDFTPLVLKMRELNKKVIGVGTRGSTSRLIINACDEFIFYDAVVKGKARTDRSPARKLPKDQSKAFDFLIEAIQNLQREDPTAPLASVVKTAMVRRRPDFSEEEVGYASFTRFLEAARDAGLVTLNRDQKSGGYRVDTVDEVQHGGRPTAPAASVITPDDDALLIADDVEINDAAYYPAGADKVLAVLNSAGLSPLAAPARLALLEALVGAVKERDEKKRRTTIPFVVEDIKRRLRRTHPDLSAKAMKEIFNALLKINVLVHPKDGTPIRSANAPFTISRTAAQLNQGLTELYLHQLKGSGTDLSDVAMLAELFYGDRDRRRDVELVLAWASAPAGDDDLLMIDDAPAASGLDALLSEEEPAGTPADAEGEARRRRNRRGRGRGDRRDDRPEEATAAPAAKPADGPMPELDDDLFLEGEAPPPRERSDRRGGDRDRRGGDRDRRDRRPAPARSDDLDLDALLVADEPAASFDDLLIADEPAAPKAPAAKPAAKPAADASMSLDDLLLPEEPVAPPEPVAAAPAAEEPAAPAEEPAKKPRSRAKKKAEEVLAEAPAELPAEAGDEPAPAKKPRAPRKKKTDEAAEG